MPCTVTVAPPDADTRVGHAACTCTSDAYAYSYDPDTWCCMPCAIVNTTEPSDDIDGLEHHTRSELDHCEDTHTAPYRHHGACAAEKYDPDTSTRSPPVRPDAPSTSGYDTASGEIAAHRQPADSAEDGTSAASPDTDAASEEDTHAPRGHAPNRPAPTSHTTVSTPSSTPRGYAPSTRPGTEYSTVPTYAPSQCTAAKPGACPDAAHISVDDEQRAVSDTPTDTYRGAAPAPDTDTDTDRCTCPPAVDDSGDSEYADTDAPDEYRYAADDAPRRCAPWHRPTDTTPDACAGATHSYAPDATARDHTIDNDPNVHCHAEPASDASSDTNVPPDSKPSKGEPPSTDASASYVTSSARATDASASHRHSTDDAIMLRSEEHTVDPGDTMCEPVTDSTEPIDDDADGGHT